MSNPFRAVARAVKTGRTFRRIIRDAAASPPTGPRDRAERLSRAFQTTCAAHGFDIRATGPIPTGPCVIAANHLSYIDPVVILAKVVGVPIAKDAVGEWPIIGAGAKELGVILVERDNMMKRALVLRRALRALQAGLPVVNFPEGTTTDGTGEMLPFHRGTFGIARLAGAPVVPVALGFGCPGMTWTGTQTFLPHYLRTAARKSTPVYLRFGAPISSTDFASAEALSRATRVSLENLLSRGFDEPAECSGVSPTRPKPLLSTATG